MPELLISVTTISEAQIALQCGADIIDLKDPAEGALGALPLGLINEITAFVHAQPEPKKMVSATIGDLPMQPELLLERVLELSTAKADIIKIGFFAVEDSSVADYQACLDALHAVCASGLKLVAVLFAEQPYPPGLIADIAKAGFYGVMVDTAEKNGNTFLDYMTFDEAKAIVSEANEQRIIFGIAGSLALQHVNIAKAIEADYIGFRGGVCESSQRKAALVPEKISAIRMAL